ncbi:MAG: hypothetical protein K0R40_370, partial [Burkholderiales bacterium]|nr:hypothetical protein [Burkholderiales bacterium]
MQSARRTGSTGAWALLAWLALSVIPAPASAQPMREVL